MAASFVARHGKVCFATPIYQYPLVLYVHYGCAKDGLFRLRMGIGWAQINRDGMG